MVKAVTGLRARVRTSGGTRRSRAKTPSAMAQKGHGRDLTAAPRPRSARPIALIPVHPAGPIIGGAGPRCEALTLTHGAEGPPAALTLELGLNPGYYRLAPLAPGSTGAWPHWRLAPLASTLSTQ